MYNNKPYKVYFYANNFIPFTRKQFYEAFPPQIGNYKFNVLLVGAIDNTIKWEQRVTVTPDNIDDILDLYSKHLSDDIKELPYKYNRSYIKSRRKCRCRKAYSRIRSLKQEQEKVNDNLQSNDDYINSRVFRKYNRAKNQASRINRNISCDYGYSRKRNWKSYRQHQYKCS